jgi:type VI protein secretion system component Hcp
MRTRLALPIAAGVALALVGPAAAGSDYTLRIDGVGAITLSEVVWSTQAPGVRGPEQIVVTKPVDAASPALSRCAATHCVFRSASLWARVDDAVTTYALTGVSIVGIQTDRASPRPMETLTLHMVKVAAETRRAPGP